MWSLGVPLGEKILRPILVYAFLVVALRLAGKRELAQLTTLDFIVLLAVANAVQNGIIGNDNSVSGALVGATVLFTMNGILALVLYRFLWLRRLVAGRPTMLIRDGKLDERALRRERLSSDDLLNAVQGEGAESFADVALAKLEPNGKLVIQLRTSPVEEQQRAELSAEVAAVRREQAELAASVAAVRHELAQLTDLVRRTAQ
jgi:uncharacterized membrane protein YcaP (DUF421 family)